MIEIANQISDNIDWNWTKPNHWHQWLKFIKTLDDIIEI